MSRRYVPKSNYALAVYGEDEVELDFDPIQESDMLHNGHLDLVPIRYRVLSPNYVGPDGDAKQGDEFEAALTQGQEQSLVDGGHLERVEAKPPAKKAAAKKKASSDDD